MKEAPVDGKEQVPVDGQEPHVDGQEPPPPLSDAAIFIKTRKRHPNRTYKLPVEAIKKKIVSMSCIFFLGL